MGTVFADRTQTTLVAVSTDRRMHIAETARLEVFPLQQWRYCTAHQRPVRLGSETSSNKQILPSAWTSATLMHSLLSLSHSVVAFAHVLSIACLHTQIMVRVLPCSHLPKPALYVVKTTRLKFLKIDFFPAPEYSLSMSTQTTPC